MVNKVPDSNINIWNNLKNNGEEQLIDIHISSIIGGFLLATLNGPLCEEPMWGVCFLLEDVSVPIVEENQIEPSDTYGSLSGQIISRTKELCRSSFLFASPRLVEAYLKCQLQCDSDQLGKLYSAFGQKRGRIISEDIWEGTNIFTITALVPVSESIGLATVLIDKTSGGANHPQLVFSHWEILDIDPYFKPTSEEDIEEFGDEFGEKNLAKILLEQVRRRKGLISDRKIIKDAEKQRTLSKKK